jgi:hypothetical protein
MAAFGNLIIESVVQTNDRTRISAVKTEALKGSAAISKVQIKPSAAEPFVDVTGSSSKDWFLDYQYPVDGTHTITLEVTTGTGGGVVVETFNKDIEVIDAADDYLLSSDDDLVEMEPDIMNWIQKGRTSYLREHRAAQKCILEWLDNARIWRVDGSKLQKQDLSFSDDFKKLSVYKALEIIFYGISNKVDDVHLAKSKSYASKYFEVQNLNRIRADFDGDGVLTEVENVDNRSYQVFRR